MRTELQENKYLRKEVRMNNLCLLFLVGAILNLSVMAFNNNQMPVHFDEDEPVPPVDELYAVFDDPGDVTLPYLGDIIDIGKMKVSIGDIIMVLSASIMALIIFKGTYIRIKEGGKKDGINGISE